MSDEIVFNGKCVCGWDTPKDTLLISKTPEFFPDDTEFEYRCPKCNVRHYIEFTREDDQNKAAS